MTLEQLRVFVAVAEREHVTRAAKALNLTQSAVSAAIQALEARHAVALFHRVGRRIELTEAGRVFLDEARDVLSRAAAAELALAELGGLERGTLTLHASQTVASYWLPRHLVDFRKWRPGIAIQVAMGNTSEVAKAVRDGAAELGFVEGRVDERDLLQRAVARDQLVVVVGDQHPWVGRKRINRQDLLSIDWVVREPGSGTRSEFELALKRFSLPLERLNIVLELPSNEAVRLAVEAGAGAAVMSELVAETDLREGRLKRVPLHLPQRAFNALRHRERYLSKAGQALLDQIKHSGGS